MNISGWIWTIAWEVLTSVGIMGILKKCGNKLWYAFVPGYRWYALSDCVGREGAGYRMAAAELCYMVFRGIQFFIVSRGILLNLLVLSEFVSLVAMIVYRVHIAEGICLVFNVKKYWNPVWALVPSLAAMVFGYDRKKQPIYIDRYNDDGVLAGTRPALLDEIIASHISKEDAAKPGLHIRVRERTAIADFKKRYLLKDINLDIPNGSLVLLLGGSGAGKTTLVNAVNGYEKADADIYLNGKNIYENYDQMKYRIGFVPQQDLLRMNDTVQSTLEDAALLRMPQSVTAAERKKKIEDVMETLGMAGRTGGLVAKKSGGQKKRISIGMELISDPDLFILDEPDSGLDGVIARELFEKLRQIADQGKVIIAITHTPDRVADLFDKVIVLARDSGRCGRLAFYGSPDEAREFFGRDTMEQIVMCVNREEEGGEGRADEFIRRYAALTNTGKTAAEVKEPAVHQEERKTEKKQPEEKKASAGKKKKKKMKKSGRKGGRS